MNEIENRLKAISEKINTPESGQFIMPVKVKEKKKISYKKTAIYLAAIASLWLLFFSGLFKNVINNDSTKGSPPPPNTTSNSSENTIVLNPLGESMGLNSTKITFNCPTTYFGITVPVYSVRVLRPTEEQITSMLSKLKFMNPVKEDENEIRSFTDEKGNRLTINLSSGAMEYSSERIQNANSEEWIQKSLTKAEYIKRAKDFLTELGIGENFLVKSAGESMFVEGGGDKNQTFHRPVRYEVIFAQQSVDGYEFEGSGPGARIEFDSSGKVVSMLAINRVPSKISSTVMTKDQDEILAAFERGDYIFKGTEELDTISLDSCKLILYSDPAQMKQQYMVPFYKFTGKNMKDGRAITVIMNALKEDEYTISQ